jgi:hypothetical protein
MVVAPHAMGRGPCLSQPLGVHIGFAFGAVGPPSRPESSIVGMSGGCSALQVFAQNRWAPLSTAIRVAPNVLSAQNGSFPGNMSIAVNGWVHSRAAYPTNPPPRNNDVWCQLG